MKRFSLACVVLVLFATVPRTWGTVRQNVPQTGITALEKLRASYASIHTAHLKASFVMTVYDAEELDTSEGPVQGTGHLEYWGKGDLFHIRTEADSRLGLLGNTELAYDGERYQRFLPESGILTLQNENVQNIPALPNPLFLPVDFLSRDSDACPFCILRISDLQAASTWDSVRSAFGDTMRMGNADSETVSIPGGENEGHVFVHQVTLAPEAEEFPLFKIDRVTHHGQKLMTLSFPEIETFRGAGVVATVPRIVDITIYDPEKGSVMAEVRYFISELTLNRPLDRGAFRIDQDQAEYIWNEDSGQWLKHPEPDFAAKN